MRVDGFGLADGHQRVRRLRDGWDLYDL